MLSPTPLFFLSFAAIGFFYLLPTQLLFSLWFFFLLTRLQDVVAAMFGLRISSMPLYPTRLYIGYQVAWGVCRACHFVYLYGITTFSACVSARLHGKQNR